MFRLLDRILPERQRLLELPYVCRWTLWFVDHCDELQCLPFRDLSCLERRHVFVLLRGVPLWVVGQPRLGSVFDLLGGYVHRLGELRRLSAV